MTALICSSLLKRILIYFLAHEIYNKLLSASSLPFYTSFIGAFMDTIDVKLDLIQVSLTFQPITCYHQKDHIRHDMYSMATQLLLVSA